MTIDSQLDYWNRIGPTKTFAHPVNIEKLSRWVPPDNRILDYGCGYGRALGILQSKGYWNLIGMDPAPAMIDRASAVYPQIAFSVLNEFGNTGLPAGSIDAVLLFAVLTSVPRNEDQIAIVAEITRVLRPGGLLYISDMLLQADPRNVARYERDREKYGIYGVFDLIDGATVRHHERSWIDSLLRNYEALAFDEIEAETMNNHPAIVFQWFGLRR
jgi:SAM-dependent methyltransferase